MSVVRKIVRSSIKAINPLQGFYPSIFHLQPWLVSPNALYSTSATTTPPLTSHPRSFAMSGSRVSSTLLRWLSHWGRCFTRVMSIWWRMLERILWRGIRSMNLMSNKSHGSVNAGPWKKEVPLQISNGSLMVLLQILSLLISLSSTGGNIR